MSKMFLRTAWLTGTFFPFTLGGRKVIIREIFLWILMNKMILCKGFPPTSTVRTIKARIWFLLNKLHSHQRSNPLSLSLFAASYLIWVHLSRTKSGAPLTNSLLDWEIPHFEVASASLGTHRTLILFLSRENSRVAIWKKYGVVGGIVNGI